MKKLTTEEMHRLTVEEFRESAKLPLTVVLDNVRSLNNIGSVFRTADAFRVEHIALCGITATPPHREIHKTALGAEESVEWSYHDDTVACVQKLKARGYKVYAVEIAHDSIKLGSPQASRLHLGAQASRLQTPGAQASRLQTPGPQASRLQMGAQPSQLQTSGPQPSRLHAGETPALPESGETPAHPELPNERRRGYLPHFENRDYQSITFRLYDSVPKELIEEWQYTIAQESDRDNLSETSLKLHQLIDKFEDAGYGQCFLSDARVANIMRQALEHDDGTKYDLLCYCIMPNHVHVMVRVYEGVSLSTIMHSWRSFTAHEANIILQRTGDFWMKDYYDRYIRNADHYRAVALYIEQNPVKAGLNNVLVKQAPLLPGFGTGVGMVMAHAPGEILFAGGTSAVPFAGETPAVPDAGGTPAVPFAGGTPAVPDAGETPAVPDAGETPALPGETATHPVAIVLGNEIDGVQEEVMELCDGALEIPQEGTKHSLNVSCAAAIVMWEMYKTMIVKSC